MSRQIAVVGATGFLGSALCAHFQQRGFTVYGYGPDASRRLPDGSPLVRFDALLDEIVFPEGTEAVYYLSQSPWYRQFPDRADHLFGVNVLGAIKACRAAVDAGARFFCYASTGNVYQPSFAPLREEHPVRRDNGYALSKVMAEEALALTAERVKLVCLRIFGLFGPGQKGMLVPTILDRVRTEQPVLLAPSPDDPHDNSGLRVSLCYVDDAVGCLHQLHELAVQGRSLPLHLNLAGPEPISVRRLARECGRILGISPRFERAATPRPFDLIADRTRLEQLAPIPFTPFAEALRRTVAEDSSAASPAVQTARRP